MRKIQDVLRLYFAAALSIGAIARSLGTSPWTVGEYLRRAEEAGLSWPVPESVDDTGLERRLFLAPPWSRTERPQASWSDFRTPPSHTGPVHLLLCSIPYSHCNVTAPPEWGGVDHLRHKMVFQVSPKTGGGGLASSMSVAARLESHRRAPPVWVG